MSAAPETHCRLCAKISAENQSIPINNKAENCLGLKSTLDFLSVDISSSNTLPKSVCHGCFDMLTRIRSFYNQVRGAQEKLNAIYGGKTYVENVIVKIEPTEEVWVTIEPKPVSDDNSSLFETKNVTNTEPIDIKRALSAHMTIDIDDEERPYKCTICDTAFRAKRTLKIHLLTHSKLKPFQCDICTKSFQFKMYLQRHIAVHTDKMPFPCNVCKKQFRTNRCLQIHLRQHTGDKPYKCEVCGQDFNNWSNRYRHMKRKHNVGPRKLEKIKVDNINIK